MSPHGDDNKYAGTVVKQLQFGLVQTPKRVGLVKERSLSVLPDLARETSSQFCGNEPKRGDLALRKPNKQNEREAT